MRTSCVSDTFSHMGLRPKRSPKIFYPHPSESLNNPLLSTRFLDGQTDARKAETEYRSHKPFEHLKTISGRSHTTRSRRADRRAQKGTNYIDCLLNSAIIFNKFLTDGYYLAIYKRAIFVPVFIN